MDAEDVKEMMNALWDRLDNVITETSYYFVAAPRPTTAAVGRVVEDVSDVADKPPVRGAVVRVRGQEAVTDGNGGFVVRGILANAGDKISAEVSWIRPDGRVYRQQGAFVDAVVNGLTGLGEIRLETEAILALLEMVPDTLEPVRSSAHDLENDQNTMPRRAARVRQWLADFPLLKISESDLLVRVEEMIKAGFKNFDALHLASAELGGAESFVTCDDRLIATARRCEDVLRIRVINPLELAKEILP